jgi:hypothetical protein
MSEQSCSCNPHPDLSELQDCTSALKQIDFELAYLALLTCEGLKPLSRWEKPLGDDGLELLRRMGLLTRQVRRTVKTGKTVMETIFSRTPAYIQLYERNFSETPIDKSARVQRIEGFLFGYPACCIEQYIRKPYTPNNLPGEEQKILFHWACRDCEVTPILLDAYKSIHALLTQC